MKKDNNPFAVTTDKKGKVIAITDTRTGEKLPQKFVRRMRNEMKKKQPFVKNLYDNSVKIVKIPCKVCGHKFKTKSGGYTKCPKCAGVERNKVSLS